MIRRPSPALALCLCLVAASGVASNAAATPPSEASYRQTFVAVRTASLTSATSFRFGASWSSLSGIRAFAGLADLRATKADVVVGDAKAYFTPIGSGNSVEVQAAGRSIHVCADYELCAAEQSTLVASFGWNYSDQGGPEVGNRFYIVIVGNHPAQITFDSHGWSLRKQPLSFRVLDSDETDASQARALGYGAEAYAATGQLPGGRNGSVAAATPPCTTKAESTVAQGVGQITLSAPGVADQTATCPTSPWLAVSAVRHATTWTAHGVAVGANGGNTVRLLVIDLPARL